MRFGHEVQEVPLEVGQVDQQIQGQQGGQDEDQETFQDVEAQLRQLFGGTGDAFTHVVRHLVTLGRRRLAHTSLFHPKEAFELS
jgi:hypothetical protein